MLKNKNAYNKYQRELMKKIRRDPESGDRLRAYHRKYYDEHPEAKKRKLENGKRWAQEHKELINARHREKMQQQRKVVLEHYGNRCACCGETIPEFLCIDHIDGFRGKHRPREGSNFYGNIIRSGFPKNLQLLCHNCNMAKGFYGVCPHKRK